MATEEDTEEDVDALDDEDEWALPILGVKLIFSGSSSGEGEEGEEGEGGGSKVSATIVGLASAVSIRAHTTTTATELCRKKVESVSAGA